MKNSSIMVRMTMTTMINRLVAFSVPTKSSIGVSVITCQGWPKPSGKLAKAAIRSSPFAGDRNTRLSVSAPACWREASRTSGSSILASVAILSLPFSTRTPFCSFGKAMILPLLRSAIRVVLRALVRCSSRKRDSTSMVMLTDAQPMKSTPWKIGTRKERIGKPVSGLIAGSVTASVRVVLAV